MGEELFSTIGKLSHLSNVQAGSNEQWVPGAGWLLGPCALWTLGWRFTLIRTPWSGGTVLTVEGWLPSSRLPAQLQAAQDPVALTES